MTAGPATTPLLSGRDLACRRGDRLVFAGLSLVVDGGDALVVTGPNGAGKSSLLRVLAGLIPPFAGRLDLARRDDNRMAVGYVGHLDAVKGDLTALETLTFWARLADRREAAARARLALGAYGINHLADVPGRFLSAGQKRRVALARLLAAPARLWLLDEPTVALDRAGQDRLAAAIASHRAHGGAIVAATHQDLGLPGERRLDMALQPGNVPADRATASATDSVAGTAPDAEPA